MIKTLLHIESIRLVLCLLDWLLHFSLDYRVLVIVRAVNQTLNVLSTTNDNCYGNESLYISMEQIIIYSFTVIIV